MGTDFLRDCRECHHVSKRKKEILRNLVLVVPLKKCKTSFQTWLLVEVEKAEDHKAMFHGG